MPDLSNIDIQGHRGCRGLMPENTIAGFKKALELGVNTLELDVVISADRHVVVSHEAFMNHLITTKENGDTIPMGEQTEYNLYKMTYEEISKYDVGLKPHPKFTLQKKIAAVKPLLNDVIAVCDEYAKFINRPLPNYNIEIKTQPSDNEAFNPEPIPFFDLVHDIVISHDIHHRCTIQSFDHEILKVANDISPELKYAMLVGDTLGYDYHIARIGFTPKVYSPYYKLVDKDLVAKCHKNKMTIIPWTVNEAAEVEALLKMGVDGIISDYPDMVLEVVESLSTKI